MPKLLICRRCFAPVIRKDRRCSLCKARHSGAALRGGVSLRQQRRASRYLMIRFFEQKQRSRRTDIQIAQKVYRLHARLLRRFSWKAIVVNGLDNPYMTELARRVIINQVAGVPGAMKKEPAQSTRSEKKVYTTAGRIFGLERRAA